MTDEKKPETSDQTPAGGSMTPERIRTLLREAASDAQELDDRLKRVFSMPGDSVPIRRK